MVEIVACPECGKPRALGHRCPSCGDASTTAGQQAPAPGTAQSWHQPTSPGGHSGGAPASFSSATPTRPTLGQDRGRGRLVGAIAALAVIVVAIVVVVVLTRGGGEVVEEQASMAGAPALAYDLAAQSLLRNAMTTFDMAVAEFGGFEEIGSTDLQTMEPSITWTQGSAGLSASPPTSANAKQSSVAWVSTGPLSYELGTWSASGVEFGVKVDRMGGGITYYEGGEAGSW